jgi:hypothetical protein
MMLDIPVTMAEHAKLKARVDAVDHDDVASGALLGGTQVARIQWALLDSKVVEDVISMLLNHLHPDRAQRIDGAGGDGGRDVQLILSDGLHVFEVKSFTGRLGSTQRRQVRRSLLRARLLGPVSWTLLVPINHTPKELEWFTTLQREVTFPISWRGLDWLDAELAMRPFIARYLVEGTAEELEELLRLARQEEAGLLGGAPDAAERVQRVVSLLNDQNPFWRFEVRSDGTSTSISPIPRYRGAENDRPITIEVQFSFPDDQEGRQMASEFQEAVDFGAPVSVPGEYVKQINVDAPVHLGTFGAGGRIDIGPGAAGPPVELLLSATDPEGRTLAELPVLVRARTRGQRGGILKGSDKTGYLNVEVKLDQEAGKLGIKWAIDTGAGGAFYPADMRPLVRFLSHQVSPNVLVVRTAEGGAAARAEIPATESAVEPGFARLIDDLVLVQWAAGLSRRVGPKLNKADADAISVAAKMLRGETVTGSWTDFQMEFREDASEAGRSLLIQNEFRVRLVAPRPHVALIDGIEYHVGRGVEHEMESATLAPEHRIWRETGVPPGAKVRLVPGRSTVIRYRIVSEERMRRSAGEVGGEQDLAAVVEVTSQAQADKPVVGGGK